MDVRSYGQIALEKLPSHILTFDQKEKGNYIEEHTPLWGNLLGVRLQTSRLVADNTHQDCVLPWRSL